MTARKRILQRFGSLITVLWCATALVACSGPVNQATTPPSPRTAESPEILGLYKFGNDILGVSRDGTIKTLRGSTSSLGTSPQAVAFDETRQLLAFSAGRIVYLADPGDPKPKKFLELRTRVTSMAFEPGGASLLMGGVDGGVYRHNILSRSQSEGTALERYSGHASVVSAVEFHPSRQVFFSGDWQGVLNGWKIFDRRFERASENTFGTQFFSNKADRAQPGREDDNAVERLLVTKDGSLLFVALQSGTIELWRVRGVKQLSKIEAHEGPVYDLDYSDRLHRLASAGRDGHVKLWSIDLDQENPLKSESQLAVEGVSRLKFGDESSLILGGKDGSLKRVPLP
jgi:WD40 repeat protein